MAEKLQTVRGMNDLLPQDTPHWQRVEGVLREVAHAYGYLEIRTPVLERAELFTHALGTHTDIVEKEMYAFTDRGGDLLALRPEATASTVRACNQHGLLHNTPRRLWYLGPMFRRERPQRGRYRQFHQFGLEAFGWPGPDIDAELLLASARLWRRLGLGALRLLLNTLGPPETGRAYRVALVDYFRAHLKHLDADSLRRLDHNPMRILDSKVPATMEVVAGAPPIQDFLDGPTRTHFEHLGDMLRRGGVEFTIEPRLVRGLDYYTGTVFEWVTDQLGAQGAVCAGGRYDDLVAARGGRPTPAVGFALGVERLVELVRDADATAVSADTDIYVATDYDEEETMNHHHAARLAENLRDAGYAVIAHCGGGKLKNQLRRATQSGARIAVIAGAAAAQVRITRLGAASPPPLAEADREVKSEQLAEWCREHLGPGSLAGGVH